MSMKIIGLDLSINSTGICIYKKSEQNSYNKYLIISGKDTKKLREFSHEKITIEIYDKKDVSKAIDYSSKESVKSYNIYSIAKCIERVIKKEKPDLCVIEGVSYRSSGAVADLAGLNYMVRYILEENHIAFKILSPMQNKKLATGNGGADKDLMIDAWKRLDKDIYDIESIKIDDLADAFFLAHSIDEAD